jgi:hypothetical protein
MNYTVPVAAYFDVSVEAEDADEAIVIAERAEFGVRYRPSLVHFIVESGPTQCVNADRVYDQEPEEDEEN